MQKGESCRIVRNSPVFRRSRLGYLVGPLLAGVGYYIAAPTQWNEYASARTRLVFERPIGSDSIWREVNKFVDWVHRQNVEPTAFPEWVERFTGTARDILVRQKFVCDHEIVPDREYRKYKTFVKGEVQNAYFYGGEYSEKKPRNINGAPVPVKVELGPNFHAYSKHLAQECRKLGVHLCHLLYACGQTREFLSDWVVCHIRRLGCALEDDFSCFDGTCSRNTNRLKVLAAKRLGLRGRKLRIYRFLEKKSTFVSRHGVITRRFPGTLSGHPDTSWGNSVINITVHVFAIIEAWRRKYHPAATIEEVRAMSDSPHVGRDFVIAALGDDMIGAIRPQYVQGVAAIFTDLGFKPKIKFGHDLVDLRFCSNALYPTREGRLVFAPTMKCLCKMNATISDLSHSTDKQILAHVRGVSLGLLALTNHVPLLSDMVQVNLQRTIGAHGKEMKMALRAAQLKYLPAENSHFESIDSHYWLSQQLKIPLWVVATLRHQIREMLLPAVYNSPSIEIFVQAVAKVELA